MVLCATGCAAPPKIVGVWCVGGWNPSGVFAVYVRRFSSIAAVIATASRLSENFRGDDVLLMNPIDRLATSASANGLM